MLTEGRSFERTFRISEGIVRTAILTADSPCDICTPSLSRNTNLTFINNPLDVYLSIVRNRKNTMLNFLYRLGIKEVHTVLEK